MWDKDLLNLHYLCVFGSIIYIFFYKEKCILKPAKWDIRALKDKLVGFNRYIIYKVHIKDQNKVIRVKNLQIFEDISTKANSTLLDFDKKPIFDVIQILDKQDLSNKNSASKDKKTKIKPFQKPKKFKWIEI